MIIQIRAAINLLTALRIPEADATVHATAREAWITLPEPAFLRAFAGRSVTRSIEGCAVVWRTEIGGIRILAYSAASSDATTNITLPENAQ